MEDKTMRRYVWSFLVRQEIYCIPDSRYRIPLQAPIAMAREIKNRAAVLDTVVQAVEIKHPMVRAFRHPIHALLTDVTDIYPSAVATFVYR